MSVERPDFSVNSRGEADATRAKEAVRILNVPGLVYEAAPQAKGWGDLLRALAAELRTRRESLTALYGDELAAATLIYDPVARPLIIRAFTDAGVREQDIETLWREAFEVLT